MTLLVVPTEQPPLHRNLPTGAHATVNCQGPFPRKTDDVVTTGQHATIDHLVTKSRQEMVTSSAATMTDTTETMIAHAAKRTATDETMMRQIAAPASPTLRIAAQAGTVEQKKRNLRADFVLVMSHRIRAVEISTRTNSSISR